MSPPQRPSQVTLWCTFIQELLLVSLASTTFSNERMQTRHTQDTHAQTLMLTYRRTFISTMPAPHPSTLPSTCVTSIHQDTPRSPGCIGDDVLLARKELVVQWRMPLK